MSANTRVGADDKDPFRGEDIPGVAVDPADARHLVMLDQNFVTGQCEVRVTFDAGSTWAVTALRAPAAFVSPPCVEFDSSGYPHVNQSIAFGSNNQVYTTFDSTTGPREVFTNATNGLGQGDSTLVAKSTDGGKTFGVATVVLAAPPGPQPYYVRPTVGVDPRPAGDRVVVAAWGELVTSGGPADGAGDRRLVSAVSNDGGATWSAPVDASAPGEQVREPSPAVFGADGTIYLAWRNRDNPPSPSNEIVAKSTDGGATWVRSLAGAVTGLGQGVNGGAQEIAIDRSSGALYLVYQEQQPFGDQDVWFQKSTDGAATWSKPLRVNDDPTGNGVRQHLPHISVAPNGRIDVVWIDGRNAYPSPVIPPPRGGADVYYAASTDGGATFSANRRITDRTINQDMGLIGRIGSYSWYGPVVASLGNDGVFFAWSDPREGNVDTDTNDIYTATLHLGAANASPLVQELPKTSPAELSVAAAQLAYPGGTERVNSALTAKLVVVNKNDVAAAWAGAVLARDNGAPLLVVDGKTLSKDAKTEIGFLHPTGVYVIGDQNSIPDSLVSAITQAGVTQAPPTTVPTTAAPTTTTTAAPTASTTTTTIPTRNQFAATAVVRLNGATAADIGRAVAGALDVRSDADRSKGTPAAKGAVVVNPDSQDGAAALGLAAALRLPVLFATKDAVPAPTTDAISALNIQKTYVVGGSASVSDAAMAKLPGATRLGGADSAATSMAVAKEAAAQNVPVNVVYVADPARPVDAAVAATVAARNGGLLLLSPGAGAPAAQKQLGGLNLTPMVDRIEVVRSSSTSSTSVPWPVIIVSILLAVVGIALLGRAAAKRRSRPPTVTTSTTTAETRTRP
ncbi:MAG TPA: sialidase family protein [Acidimicrobiales bacterium]|nr:sialidase family protein [Acidimicrobiales bacterium]